ncbi:alpha-protein kinase 1 [Megalops cyprinoides]|uniref:alpha-protein kinase 1 n=1 Tax=Megalops cyprinoides TaxID=118141 RepID=UPI0018643FD7|nr:alpha-protein kinase 1 [Megalops cyprinoides]
MNNQDVVAVLEECRRTLAAGPVEPTGETKKEFHRCRAALSAELSTLLQEAVAMKWPFVPEKWQYKHSVTPEDRTNLKELISQQLPQLLMFLRASLLAGEPVWAVSAVFLMDRFLYWADASASLLRIAKVLHKLYPATPIAPQLVIRQARVSLNSGELMCVCVRVCACVCAYVCVCMCVPGCWVYHADSDRTLVQAVSVQVRGQILQKLGLWVEAAELIWASLIGFHSLPEPDKKGIGTSLGLLANILVSMNDDDFRVFTTSPHIDLWFLREKGHRLLSAAEAAKLAVVYGQYASLYVLTHVVTQGTCLLSYSFSSACPAAEREGFLSEARQAFEIGLLTRREGEDEGKAVSSMQELHSFLKAAYSLTVARRWLGPVGGRVREAGRACGEALAKLCAYSVAGGRERDALAAEVMRLVGRVRALLRVEPFPVSDERSFIPDSYAAAAGEAPTRLPPGRFATAMARFQQYHASVCQASEASCARSPGGSGGQGSPGACITAMRTATETLGTDCATETRQPQGTLGRGQEKHSDSSFSAGLGEKGLSSLTGGTAGESVNRYRPSVDLEGRGRNSSSTHTASGCTGLNEAKLTGRGGEASSSSLSDSLGSQSSWQKISPSDTGSPLSSDKHPGVFGKQSLEPWVDLQCPTETSDEEEVNGGTSRAGCGSEGLSKVRTFSSSLSDSLSSTSSWQKVSRCDTGSPLSSDKDASNPVGQREEAWVDLQCPTEDGDDEEGQDISSENAGRASLAAGEGKRVGGYRQALSAPSRDSVGSTSHRSTPFPEVGGERTLNYTDASSPVQGGRVEGVDLQCPTELSDGEEWTDGTGSQNCGPAGLSDVRAFSSSLSDSLGSTSSWQKISPSDTESPLSSGRDGSDPVGQREEAWVDLQCPTEDGDEGEDQGGTGGSGGCGPFPALRLEPEGSSAGPGDRLSRLTTPLMSASAPAPNSSPGGKQSVGGCRSEGDRSCPPVEFGSRVNTEGAVPRNDGGVAAADWAGGCGSLQEQCGVDPLAETEEGPLDDLGVPSPVPTASVCKPAGCRPAVTRSERTDSAAAKESASTTPDLQCPTETHSFQLMGDTERHEEYDFGKLSLDENQNSASSKESHDQCLRHCMLGSAVSNCPRTLTEQDYKALLSGVCHECLLKRLENTGTFRLKKHDSTYSALLLKYSKVSGQWTARETKVHIGAPMDKEGKQRTAFWVKLLHQEETLGSYVGKTYKVAKEVRYHLTDVERQMAAQYYVTEFNKRLYEKRIPAQIFFIPSEVLLILEDDVIVDCVTVEPYMLGDFVKLTNNTTKANRASKATDYGIAFGHFTYQLSAGTEVVVDLQGWVTANGKGLTYLTDPQLHTLRKPSSSTNFGQRGIRHFLEDQHGPQCNDICNSLSLGSL